MKGDRWTLRIIGAVPGAEKYPELVEHVGRYVQGYEPDRAPLGEQWLWTTDDPAEAKVFENAQVMHTYYAQSIGTRPDGKPDRPLTMFHIQADRVETA